MWCASTVPDRQTVFISNRIPAGNYIVKSTPIVTCGEITPGSFEVTVPKEKLQENYIYLWYRDQNPTPYQNDGKVRYYSAYPLDNIKWRVLDVVTGAELNKGEARPSKQIQVVSALL